MAEPADLSAISGLVQRLRSRRSVAQLQAARELTSLALAGSSAQRAIAEAGAMPILMRPASSERGPVVVQQGAAVALAEVIRGQQDLTEAFVAAGGVPLLVHLLVHGGSEELQLAGAGLATAVMQDASYSWCSDAQTAVAEAGGIPILVQLMGSEPSAVAVVALANVVADRHEHVHTAVAAGAASLFAQRLLSERPGVLPCVSLAISSLAAGGPVCCAALVAAGAVPKLVQLLSDDSTLLQAAGALANMAAVGDQEHRQAVVAAGAIPGFGALPAGRRCSGNAGRTDPGSLGRVQPGARIGD